ncbi:zinc finger protein 250-like isoform X11 [Spodoptera litura]|uniref:Zinc finger protein 250-like isoform X11 n=1 Tax=Spodoptera litura TaxID=69820 RepID=A0A9J7IKV6_SPOLT|nr:zinc finger protein 250-like isoform X11 [Spodoptera litura]
MDPKTTDWRAGPNVCRCCLAEGCYKDISTEYFWMGKREVYAEMLSETLNLSIAYSNSGGPNSNSRLICELCISRLRDASDFKRQVQECERTFLRHLDPGSSSMVGEVEVTVEPTEIDPDVKLEHVKQEKAVSDDDDDFDERCGFDEDDDDDLDDQPLTRLASRIPKKESVDLLDLLDNTKATEKRKSSSKTKTVPAKKAKTIKKDVKATSSKAPVKTEKKKKEKQNDPNFIAKRNAEVIVKYSTVYPFKLPEENMVCVYCCESFPQPAEFRAHMDEEHETFNPKMAFLHCSEGYIKVDCTNINCRLCFKNFPNLDEIADHLYSEHKKPLDLSVALGLQPFNLENNKLFCAICRAKALCLRQLSRHTQSHFWRYTCEACGKSYATNTALRSHIRFSHIGNEKICRKCKRTFSSIEEKRKHMLESQRCWSHLCCVCGERFISWHAKQLHLSECHGVEKKVYVCPECGVIFHERKKYRTHFRLSHTDDNYVCSCCGMKFVTKKTLEEHRVSHTMEKLFPCTVCSKSFPRKKNLVQHMWIHMENKRFECKMCNKKFNQKVSWKTHMKSYHPELVEFEGKNNNIKLVFPF